MPKQKKKKRKAAPAGARRGGYSSDWIWGLGLAIIVLGIVGGVALFSLGGVGGGGSGCDEPLPPLSDEPLTTESFAQAKIGISQVIADMGRGAFDDAESAFYLEVHQFAHTLDPEIRPKDEDLAKELCESIIFLEEQFAEPSGQDRLRMSARAETIRNDISEAEAQLDLENTQGQP